MNLSAPIAFAAALIGGALGGILFAFFALPAAGMIMAAYRAYGRYYEVVENETARAAPAEADAGPRKPAVAARPPPAPPAAPARRAGTGNLRPKSRRVGNAACREH